MSGRPGCYGSNSSRRPGSAHTKRVLQHCHRTAPRRPLNPTLPHPTPPCLTHSDASVAKISGSVVPQGYTCVIEPVAALPGDTPSPSPSPKPAKGGKHKSPPPSSGPTSAPKSCKPGSAPAGTGKGTSTGGPKNAKKGDCRVCPTKTYSSDGTECKKCPTAKVRGATSCPGAAH